MRFGNISASFLRNYNIKVLAVDATGVGDPIASRLSANLSAFDIKVLPIKFSEQTKNEMAILFYEEMRAKRIRVPGHQSVRKTRRYMNFTSQWFACEKNYHGKYMSLSHPDISNAHDDFVDSLLLALFAAESVKLSVPEVYKKNVFRSKDGFHSRRFQEAVNFMGFKKARAEGTYSMRIANFKKRVKL